MKAHFRLFIFFAAVSITPAALFAQGQQPHGQQGPSYNNLPELKGIEPARNQDALPLILRKVGANVQAFFRNFISTTSVEEIHQSRTGINNREDLNSMKLNYLLLVDPEKKGGGLKEYRTDSKGKPATISSSSREFMLTSGFASVSIYFDPKYQAGSTFRYLGRKMVNKRELMLVGFAQGNDPKGALGGFKSGNESIPILVQGVAWIDPATYQIVRLRTDLLAPMMNVNLEQLTTDVSFREVRFKDASKTMWLPREVNVAVKYQDIPFHNQHLYSDYRFFNVEAGLKTPASPSARSPE